MFEHVLTPTPDATTKNQVSSSGNYEKYPELKELDARLRHISNHIIQPAPYILTVPSTHAKHLQHPLPDDWRRGTPFDQNEEQLQYVSFLRDWDHGLIRPVGGWDNARGEIMHRSNSQQSNKSGTSMGGAKKIKYSLADYKKKAAGQLPTDKETGGGKVNGGTAMARESSSSQNDRTAPKRPREDGEIAEDTDPAHTPKRRRSSTALSESPQPKRRSPSPSVLELPPDISPTLPPEIEHALARLDKLEKLDDPPKPRKSAPSKQDEHRIEKSKPQDAKKSERAHDHDPTGKSKTRDPDRHSHNPNGLPVQSRGDRDGSSKPSRIVRLRIPKSIRKNVLRLLKMPPQRQRQAESSSKGVARRVEHERPSEHEKRPRPDDEDELPRLTHKRPKPPPDLNVSKPSTPIAAPFRSPALAQSTSTQKPSITSDPSSHKNLSASRDEGHASTPLATVRNGTPSAPRPQRPQQYKALRHLEQDMFTLGRNSKHKSDREFNPGNEERPSSMQVKRGLAFGLECILSFMLSYSVRDEINRVFPPDGPLGETWTTIFPYIRRVRRCAADADQQALHGLCLQLEAFCHLAVWNSACERAAGPDPEEAPPPVSELMKHYHSSTALFIEGNALLSLDTLQQRFPKTWLAKSATPLAAHRSGQANGLSSSNGNGGGGGGPKFDPSATGPFALPLSNVSTGVEVVRAGLALLVEWAAAQKADWTASLGAKKREKEEK